MQGSLPRRTISEICHKNRKTARVDLIIPNQDVQSLRITKAIFSLVFALLIINVITTYAQEARLATFHETAQLIVDQRFQNQTSTSITIISTSTQEMQVPVELDQKIHSMKNVTAVIVTNEDKCIPGVIDQACILVNISREGFSGGITKAQSIGKEVGDTLIDDINNAFSTDAKFHSVFIHFEDKINRELETSGIISGKGTISAVYTMSKSDTSYLFEKLAAILLPIQIRESGGFLNVAKKMSEDPVSSVTFSIIPKNNISFFHLQVSRDYPINNEITSIDPLEMFGVDKLERSNYFNAGFFPLNSLVQVVVLSNDAIKVTSHGSELVPALEKDGEKTPTDLTKNGWLFDPQSGNKIIGKYLFGKTTEVTKNDLKFTIEQDNSQKGTEGKIDVNNDSIYVLIGIGVAASVAIVLYLKNPKKKSLEN